MDPKLNPAPSALASSDSLTMSDGILLILDALETDEPSRSAERTLLEGMASIARLPHLDASSCPILAAFKRDDWLLYMHESLAYLQQMDRIEQATDGFELTVFGRQRLDTGLARWRDDPSVDYDQVRRLAERVREGLGLGPGLMQATHRSTVSASQ